MKPSPLGMAVLPTSPTSFKTICGKNLSHPFCRAAAWFGDTIRRISIDVEKSGPQSKLLAQDHLGGWKVFMGQSWLPTWEDFQMDLHPESNLRWKPQSSLVFPRRNASNWDFKFYRWFLDLGTEHNVPLEVCLWRTIWSSSLQASACIWRFSLPSGKEVPWHHGLWLRPQSSAAAVSDDDISITWWNMTCAGIYPGDVEREREYEGKGTYCVFFPLTCYSMP